LIWQICTTLVRGGIRAPVYFSHPIARLVWHASDWRTRRTTLYESGHMVWKGGDLLLDVKIRRVVTVHAEAVG
jgi:hypothetical protein